MPRLESFPPGSLAVVALPLGNAGDVTLRALEVLRSADVVAAEDTRTVSRFLRGHGIRARLCSYHDWNEAERAPRLLERVAAGERVALVSEAGTPGISDPGYDVVRLARQRGLPVFPVPGPSAVAAFLSTCGLPTHAFSFFGFPPNRSSRRKTFFSRLSERAETLVFYESPRRTVAALEDALEAFGDREAALAREMTKLHEEFLFGRLSEICRQLEERPKVLGEVCWGVRGNEPGGASPTAAIEPALREISARGLPPRKAARELASRCGLKVGDAYRILLERRSGADPGAAGTPEGTSRRRNRSRGC
jgi:16S rRNA (cytidine1402-2'-O)-methyltransferase